MADKYYRLVAFVVNICPLPLRELFLKYMNADPAYARNSIGGYLALRKPELEILRKRKVIKQDQWELVFPTSGQVDYSSWDITLIILLIDELFKMQLQKIEEDAIEDIRQIRNRLQHMAETSIADLSFDNIWNALEKATIDIAKQIQPSPRYENDIKKKIDDTKINNMPDLGDTLRYWYEHIIMKLKADIEDMKEIIMDISDTSAYNKECCSECRTILRESSVQKVGPSGNLVKRMKTVDPILVNLNHCFTTTMNEDFQPSFNSSPAVSDIKTKLRERHHVVVTGHRGIRYFETALAAIYDMGYNPKRCAEMRNSADWAHIDPEEVDLVLCREPFGDFSYADKRAKNMAAIFSHMHRAANPSDGRNPLDIVITTESKVLRQVLKDYEHDILREVVSVYQPSTESDPVDLTRLNMGSEGETRTCTQNLLDFTAVFADSYKDVAIVSKTVIDDAKAKLKQHKVILITGPSKCGKTALAVKLASSVYEKHQFLMLMKPDDLKFVTLNSICLVLIRDFAGKQHFDSAYSWQREFDMLYSAVYAGKLNVILTSEKTLLEQYQAKFGHHHLLQNTVVLKQEDVQIKEETSGENATSDIIYDRGSDMIWEWQSSAEHIDMSTYVFLHMNTTCLPKHGGCRVTEICMLAVNRKSFEETGDFICDTAGRPPLPRVTNKLVLCLQPDTEIQEVATSVSGLTNESLSHQGRFSPLTVSLMQSFLQQLKKPVCFIAHFGNAFDFRVLKGEVRHIGLPAEFDHMYCADSLVALRRLHRPEYFDAEEMSFVTTSLFESSSMGPSQKHWKAAPSMSTTQTRGQTHMFFSPPAAPASQNMSGLRNYYKEKFGVSASQTNTAEGFCKALITIAQTTQGFFEWVDRNAQKMSNIQSTY